MAALFRDAVKSCLALAACASLSASAACAQGGVPLITVATDQSSLNLSNQFGVPVGTAINQAGDFAFVGNGDSALFLRPAGASSAMRLLQIKDEAPGFPGSQIGSISRELSLNSSRKLLFGLTFRGGDKLPHSALLTFDGANYHTVVSSDDFTPGSSSVTYGLNLFPGTIGDSGDVDFATISGPVITVTYYIVPAGGSPMRIVGTNDSPPAQCLACFTNGTPNGTSNIPIPSLLLVPPLNAKGQMLLSLWGGLFIGSKDGTLSLVPMPASGPCSPQAMPTSTTLIPLLGMTAFLNNTGAVAFSNPPNSGSAAICVAAPDGSLPTPVVSAGDPAPPGVGGGKVASPLALGFDDSGDIVFQTPILGSSVTTFALLRHTASGKQPDVVAYHCETAPGVNGAVFSALSPAGSCGGGGSILGANQSSDFSGVSVANGGSISLNALLSTGGSAIYRQTGTNGPEFISLDFGGITSVDGVTFSSSNFPLQSVGQTQILNNGSVFFASYLTSGPADYAVYLGTPGNLQTLMSTADSLPAGAVTMLASTPPKASGHFVAFTAQPAAGRRNLMLADISSNPAVITRVVSDNDPGLSTAHGTPGNTVVASNFFLNDSGQIAFETVPSNALLDFQILRAGIGSVNTAWLNPFSYCTTIFLWSPSSGLAKVATTGDPVPGHSGVNFPCVQLNGGSPSPLNQAGQVAFISPSLFGGPVTCTLECFSAPGWNGVFLYSPGGAIREIVASSDMLPGESQPTFFVPNLPVPVNSAGQVAFGAQVGGGATSQGFFIRNSDDSTHRIMAQGDPVPNSADTFGFPHFISGLTGNGNLAFTAATTSALDGLFFAPAAGGPIQTVALDGGAAPGGGTFTLTEKLQFTNSPAFLANFAAMNDESDVAFPANITGGSADSGYFRAMHSGSSVGALQPVALQGQAAPGGGTFGTIPISVFSGANFALGPDGALAFVNEVRIGLGAREGLFVARPDGSLVKVAASGDTLPGGETAGLLLFSPRFAAGDPGKFVFLSYLDGGSSREAIFVTAIQPGTASAKVALSPLQGLAVSQQPVALTATVTKTAGASSGNPTGTVTFFSNGVSLGTGALNSNGQATLTTSSLAGGPNSLVAQYDGDSNFASANSSPLAEIVVGFAPPPSQLTVSQGQSLTIPLTLFAPAGSNMSFMLGCSGLPANAACSFDTNPVAAAPGGATANLKLTTMSGSKLRPVQPNAPPLSPRDFEFVSLLAALILAIFFKRIGWRRAPRWQTASCVCLIAFALAFVLAGCGTSSPSGSGAGGVTGTPKGPASFIVTGTSGTTIISTTVEVTVQ